MEEAVLWREKGAAGPQAAHLPAAGPALWAVLDAGRQCASAVVAAWGCGGRRRLRERRGRVTGCGCGGRWLVASLCRRHAGS